jgi:hypothetical protein
MGIDILPPIGILVSQLGLIPAAYGKFANSPRYTQSLTGQPLRGANSISAGSPGELTYLRLVWCGIGLAGVGCVSYRRNRIRQNHLVIK